MGIEPTTRSLRSGVLSERDQHLFQFSNARSRWQEHTKLEWDWRAGMRFLGAASLPMREGEAAEKRSYAL